MSSVNVIVDCVHSPGIPAETAAEILSSMKQTTVNYLPISCRRPDKLTVQLVTYNGKCGGCNIYVTNHEVMDQACPIIPL